MNIHSPRQLISAMPHLLGFEPQDSVVFAVFNEEEVVVLSRADIDTLEHTDLAVATLTQVAEHLTDESIAIVYYCPDREVASGLNNVIQDVCESNDWNVLDVLWVHDSRWWSLLCDDEECCPPEGQVVETLVDSSVNDLVGVDQSHYVSRQTLILSLEYIVLNTEDIQLRQDAFNAHFEEFTGVLADDQAHARNEWVGRAFSLLSSDSPLDWDALAVIAIALDDIRMRDGLLRIIFDEVDVRTRALENLRHASQRVASTHTAAAATVLAGTAWLDGNAALTQIALDRALDEDPSYSLAHLLQLALTHNVPASVWADSLEAVSFDQCLLGAA